MDSRNAVKRFGRMLLPILLAASLAAAPPSSAQSSSGGSTSSDSVVVLTPAEADSLIAALAYYEVRLQLLQVDLDECRALSRLDSLQVQATLDATHEAWYERVAKHPMIWFSLGVFLTITAQNMR